MVASQATATMRLSNTRRNPSIVDVAVVSLLLSVFFVLVLVILVRSPVLSISDHTPLILLCILLIPYVVGLLYLCLLLTSIIVACTLDAIISKVVGPPKRHPRKTHSLRKRDLMASCAMQPKRPAVLEWSGAKSEYWLKNYGWFLNKYGNFNTNATIFRLRSWLWNCEQTHDSCVPVLDGVSAKPHWVIDIKLCCLVRYEPQFKYAALSYVWGGDDCAQNCIAYLDKLQRHGSLLGSKRAFRIPNTIKDAMVLTGCLGLRYLWCDRLCIVSDDSILRHSQIRNMAYIYSRAFCTIIALDNLSANSGLSGLPIFVNHTSKPKHNRRSGQCTHVYRSRVWTLQEEAFSRRCIRLCHGEVQWFCAQMSSPRSNRGVSSTRPCMGEVPDYSNLQASTTEIVTPVETSLHLYIDIVKDYSRRDVNKRFPTDVFNAFSSIETVLSNSGAGPFVQCMPAYCIAESLLWSTRSPSKRREVVDPITGSTAASWSWVGWHCAATIEATIAHLRDHQPSFRSLVNWQVSSARDSQRFPVNTADYEAWKQSHQVVLNELRQPSSHNTCALEAATPLRPQDIDPSVSSCSYLHGRVLVAKLNLGHSRPCVLTSLESNLTAGESCHAIAISSGSLRFMQVWSRSRRTGKYKFENAYEWGVYGRSDAILEGLPSPSPSEPYEPDRYNFSYDFYDALIVEWRDGIAYRTGLARIAKDTFESATLGWIDITIG